ncbi:MAG: hypothetical protein M1837_000802 [Sclerophora amabilis]|nr:MAG: hypothetical protein M1837_000802 [Sclerophora amabilis]
MAEPLSKLERLKRRAREVDQRASKEEKTPHEEEQVVNELKQLIKEFEQFGNEADKRSQHTTFGEYLKYSHELLSKPFTVQENVVLSTKGSITQPKDKICPTYLRPWDDFSERQQDIFDDVYRALQPCSGTPSSGSPWRLFSPILALEDLSPMLMGRKIANEADLRAWRWMAAENPVTNIIDNLAKLPSICQRFGIADGVTFETYVNNLGDLNEEVLAALSIQDQISSATTSIINTNQKPAQANLTCAYKTKDGARSLLLLVDPKAPHKLSIDNLRGGLRSMNLPDEIIKRPTIPTDPEEKLEYNADRLAGAAVTQTYSYMIENGLQYSYITTGEAFVFLRIKPDDPPQCTITSPNQIARHLKMSWDRVSFGQLLAS